jgi:ATP-dependent DNA helicase RecQ
VLRRARGGAYRPIRLAAPQQGFEAVGTLQEQWQRVNESRIEMMRLYAEEDGCRRQLLLSYFGEHLDQPCGNCDNCERGADTDITSEGSGSMVRHAIWGVGRVLRQESDRAVIFFQTVGYKTLDLATALERGLLQAEPA